MPSIDRRSARRQQQRGNGLPAWLGAEQAWGADFDPLLLTRRDAGWGDPLPRSGGCRRLQPVHDLLSGALRGADLTCDPEPVMALPLLGGGTLPADAAWMLHAACVEASLCGGGLTMSLTLPAGAVIDSGLTCQARASLDRSGIDPARLEICLGHDAASLGAEGLLALSAIRDLGIGIVLDLASDPDLRAFGRVPATGLRLPAGIATSLIADRQARDAAARAIGWAHRLEATVVASGVRNACQRDVLADLDCDFAAGPIFGAPMPARQFRLGLSALSQR